MTDVLSTYTIYFNPRDYPKKYVVREFVIAQGTGFQPVPMGAPIAVVDTLEQARAALPQGLFPMGREPADERQIVETWI